MDEWDDDPLLKAVMFFVYLVMGIAVVATFCWWIAQFLAGIAAGA